MTIEGMTTSEGADKPIVSERHGRALADSRDVAAFFGRRHADVVRAIRSLVSAEPALSQRNFALAEYVDDQGKPRLKFDMDRDGFTLLAMGFTGAKPLKFKLAYIDAFNRMEAALREREAIAPSEHRDFPDWPLEELRTKKATADLYRMVYGPLSAAWIMRHLGFPTPPKQLADAGHQMALALELPSYPMSEAATA